MNIAEEHITKFVLLYWGPLTSSKLENNDFTFWLGSHGPNIGEISAF